MYRKSWQASLLILESEYRVPVRGKERRAFVLEMISDRHVCGDNRASEVCKERVETCLY